MHVCCVTSCRSRYIKGNGLQFFSFPFKRQQQFSSWLKAINRPNWSPTKWTKICSLHFLSTDYVPRAPGVIGYLKHNCVPSMLLTDNSDQSSIIQVKEKLMNEECEPTSINLKQDQSCIIQVKEEFTNEEFEATSFNPIDDQSNVIQVKEELIDEEYEISSTNLYYDQSSVTQIKEELMIEKCEAPSTNPKSGCTHINYDELINENKKLKQMIHDLQESVEERLNRQANIFRKLMNENETIFKKKLEKTKNETKILNKQKKREIANLKTLFKELKSKNMLKNKMIS